MGDPVTPEGRAAAIQDEHSVTQWIATADSEHLRKLSYTLWGYVGTNAITRLIEQIDREDNA